MGIADVLKGNAPVEQVRYLMNGVNRSQSQRLICQRITSYWDQCIRASGFLKKFFLCSKSFSGTFLILYKHKHCSLLQVMTANNEIVVKQQWDTIQCSPFFVWWPSTRFSINFSKNSQSPSYEWQSVSIWWFLNWLIVKFMHAYFLNIKVL